MTRRRARVARVAAGAAAVVLTAAGLGACADDDAGAPTTTSAAPASSSTASSPATTSSTSTSTPGATTTSRPGPAPSTSAPAPSTTTGTAPPTVTDLRAGPGGGSGEVSVVWRGVARATRYRVEHGPTASGPFDVAAVFDVATGTATRAPGVMNVYAASDGSFVLVEVVSGLTNSGSSRWFRVVAEGAGGAAAPSRAVCGAPPGAPAC